MKRFVAIVTLCALLSIGAFGALITADRQLGLPLPYSIPLSFTVVSILAPMLFAVANAVRLRRPVMIKAAPVVVRTTRRAADNPAVRRPAEGVVLLDFSNARRTREEAA
jgi:hypothetical protein